MTSFKSDLEKLINQHSMENGSNTPDFILAEFLANCLAAFDRAQRSKDRFGKIPENSSTLEFGSSIKELALSLKNHAWLERFRKANYENKYNELSPQACNDIAGYINTFLDTILGYSSTEDFDIEQKSKSRGTSLL